MLEETPDPSPLTPPNFGRNHMLKNSVSLQEAIIKRAAEGICVCHSIPDYPYLRFTVWNDRMVEITGYTLDQINRLGWFETVYEDPNARTKAIERMKRSLCDEDIIAEESEITRRDGQKRLLRISTSRLETEKGITHVLALLYDITEARKIEAALQRRDAVLEATIGQIIRVTATQLDWQTILDRTLQGAMEITGLEGGTLCLVNRDRGVLELASAINTSEEVVRDLRTREIRIGDCLCGMVAKTGDSLILWDNASGSEFATREALRREGIRFHAAFPLVLKGQCIGVLCVFARSDKKPDQKKLDLLQDLCGPIGLALENARLYEAERKAREQVTHVLESITDGFVAIDVEGCFTYANQKARELLNLETHDITGKSLWSLLPEQVGRPLRSACEEAVAGQRPIHLEEYYGDWGRWLDARIYPFQEGLAFYLHDITERKQMEQALRENEKKYRTLVEQSLQGTFVIQDMRMVFANQTFADMGGYTLEELYSLSPEQVINIVHPDDQERVWSRFGERLAGKHLPLTNNMLRAFRKDGSIAWVEYDAVLTDYSGRPAMQISVVDITERRQAEMALRESEQRYRQLAESAQDCIFIIDREGKVQYVNRSGAREFGWGPDQMRGRSIMDLFPPHTAKRQWDNICKVIQSGQGLLNSETKVIFPGREAWMNTSLMPLGTEHGQVTQVLGISRDMTERKQIEEALRESEKRYRELSEKNARLLEQARQDAQTKTTLLHEVNHRVKNNLASIIGLIRTQENFQRRKGSSGFHSTLRDLAGRVQGLAMAHNLLSAAGWSSIGLSDLATEVIHSTLQILPPDHRVSVHVSPSSIRVTPDQANTLALVINELATNTIKHGLRAIPDPSILVRVEEDGDQALFEFRDNGPGYPDPVLHEQRYRVGLHLATNLVRRDLRGDVTLRNDHGAVIRIHFGHGSA